MDRLFAFGPSEHVPMIDKDSVHDAIIALTKDCLAIIGVSSCDVHQPCKPEVAEVSNPLEPVSGKDFEQLDVFASQEA